MRFPKVSTINPARLYPCRRVGSICASGSRADFSRNVSALAAAKAAGVTNGIAGLEKSVAVLGTGLDQLAAGADALREALKGCHEQIIAAMNELRRTVDALEPQVSDGCWPLPKYREMLFIY